VLGSIFIASDVKIVKNVNNKECAPKMIFFNEIFLQRFASFLTQKVDLEGQIFALFDNSLLHQFSSQNSIVSFWNIDLVKNILNSVSLAWILDNRDNSNLILAIIALFLRMCV
jgi:hypothetical protein